MEDFIMIPMSRHEFRQMLKSCLHEILDEKKPIEKNNDSDKPMSVKEAGEFLNLARQTLYGYTSKNLIPFFKRGKKLYFYKKDLINWLSECRNKSSSEIKKEANDFINKN